MILYVFFVQREKFVLFSLKIKNLRNPKNPKNTFLVGFFRWFFWFFFGWVFYCQPCVKAVKNKANPAVKDAVKTVKEGGKMAQHKAKATLKDIKSRLRENREEIRNEELDNGGGGGAGSGTHSAPSSPVQGRSSSAQHRYGTMTNNNNNSHQFPRQNTDLNFGRGVLRKYERFDPTASKELSPDFEDMPRLEYGDLMSDLEEVMSRGKAGSGSGSGLALRNGSQSVPASTVSQHVPLAASAHVSATPPALNRPPPGSVSSQTAGDRKPSVGDLINLDAEGDTELEVVFDPLVAGGSGHRKLSRTGGNPFAAAGAQPPQPPARPPYGKYENYTPPAGSSQVQFKQFLSSMTAADSSARADGPAVRSSDDLLSEYGLHFGGLGLRTAGRLAETSTPGYGNGGVLPPSSLYPRPIFSSAPPAAAAPLPPPRSGPPLPAPATGRPSNSSFLYSSGQAFADSDVFFSNLIPAEAMPVNQRIRSLPGGEKGPGPPLVEDIFADLDPLRAAPVAAPLEADLGGIRPPAVPPRVKKGQWTTFD
jgi:hypothetical protein